MRSDDAGASDRKQCRMAYNNGQNAREGEADWMEIDESRGKFSRTLTDHKAVSATKHRDGCRSLGLGGRHPGGSERA
jgi:hypothetical protein